MPLTLAEEMHASRYRQVPPELADFERKRIEALRRNEESAAELARAALDTDGGPISALDFHALMDLAIEPREPLLGQWLLPKSLCMVHAWRGTGKTWWGLSVAYTVAAGGTFLGWRAPRSHQVVYLDGEMPADVIRERLETIGGMSEATPPRGAFQVVCADLQDRPMPNLATLHGQAVIDTLVSDSTKLIVVDNISCLVRGGEENDATSWAAVSEWALRHRRRGRAVLFVHHSGKSGKQRGTSKKEDLLDVVIGLRRPSDYDESSGAVFEVHFEKARTMHGDTVEPIEARLAVENGRSVWAVRPVVSANAERVVELWELGQTVSEIAAEVGLHKSNVTRNLQKESEKGRLRRPYGLDRNKSRNSGGSERATGSATDAQRHNASR